MRKIICAIPQSHVFLWPQTCLASLKKYPPKADGFEVEIIVIDNAWNWSPAIRGITETSLGEGITIHNNTKANPFHASALDDVVDHFEFDYLMALETDVVALNHGWLQWFVDMIDDGGRYAVGHWHHEQFVNPSCTIYRGDVLREMDLWCKANASDEMRWGPNFEKMMRLHAGDVAWLNGPFADKRGWPLGTTLKEKPSGQEKGFGWYEPGQMLHHWAVERGYPYMVCSTAHTEFEGAPAHTLYGAGVSDPSPAPLELEQLWERAYTAHLWGGTRALDIIKHEVTDQFVKSHTKYWLEREARFWLQAVPKGVQAKTIELIHHHGWHFKGLGGRPVNERDIEAGRYVNSIYRDAGIPIPMTHEEASHIAEEAGIDCAPNPLAP